MESLIGIILVIVPGVWSGTWGVTFEHQCALKGTSVVMKCTYDYPFGHLVTSVSWYKAQLVAGRYQLFHLSSLSPRPDFKYVGNYRGDCSLEINDVQHTDNGAYFFGFETTFNRWTSQTFARLSVKELAAAVQPTTVAEGDAVELTCAPGCPTPKATVWYKDGQHVPTPVFKARREDAGSYYCAVPGHETTRSDPVALNVQYAPKHVTLSVRPPGHLVRESSVTFSCSSDANPPVTHRGYSLYKDGQLVSSGPSHAIAAVQHTHSGLYHCQASNNISWRGIGFISSPEVHVDVQYRPMNVAIALDPPRVFEGNGVNMTCSCAANPAADNYTWYKRSASPGSRSLIQVGSGRMLSLLSADPSHAGLYFCQATNSLGENNSTEVLLAMERKRHGFQPLPALSGVGVSLFVTLVVAIFLLWRKWKSRAEKKTLAHFSPDRRGSASPADTIYANIHVSPSPATSAQDPTAAPKRNPVHNHDVYTLHEDEVIYSSVIIKPRNHSLQIKHSNAPPNSRSKGGENDDSVIYAAVVKSGRA